MRAFVLLFLFSMPAFAETDPWDTADKALYGSFIVLEAIDIAQTAKIKRVQVCSRSASYSPEFCRRSYYEQNPEFGDDPNMTKVVAYKLLDMAVVGGLGYVLPSALRKALFIGADVVQFSVDRHNYVMGLKWGF